MNSRLTEENHYDQIKNRSFAILRKGMRRARPILTALAAVGNEENPLRFGGVIGVPRGLLYIFWVRGRLIGNGIDFHDLCIRNGIDFRNFRNRYSVGYAFMENWYKVGYIFLKSWYKVGYTFWKN